MESKQYIDYFCHWDEPLKRHLVCSRFYFAKTRGEVVPNHDDGCWEMPHSTPRSMSWRARFVAGNRGHYEDHSGDLYQLWDCPWCGGICCPVPPRQAAG